MSDKEACTGCGAVADKHPIVGIARSETEGFEAHPVCEECWRDPAHREQPLVMHFHHRHNAEQAIRGAEEAYRQSEAGDDIGIKG